MRRSPGAHGSCPGTGAAGRRPCRAAPWERRLRPGPRPWHSRAPGRRRSAPDDRRRAPVGWPLAPLDAVHRAQVVQAFAIGIGQPLGIFIGILVPDLAAQLAELGRARGAQEAHQLADGGLERQFLGGDRREALLQVEAQRGPGHAQGAYAGPVLLPRAGVEDGLNEVQVLFHGGPWRRPVGQGGDDVPPRARRGGTVK